MRKTSKILGIIGGSVTILANVGGLIYLTYFLPRIINTIPIILDMDTMFEVMSTLNLVLCSVGIAGGILGLISSLLVYKKRVLCGVLMCVSSATAFGGTCGIIGGVLLLLAGIFALRRDPQQTSTAQDVQVQ